MNVTVNGAVTALPRGATVADAVAAVTSARTGIAAAVNGEVVTQGRWAAAQLADGDQVEVLTAVQGG